MRYLVMVGLLAVAPVAWADETSNIPDVLEQPQETQGATRLSSPEVPNAPHLQQGLGQSPDLVIRSEIARQRALEAERQDKRDAKAAGKAAAASSAATSAAAAAQPQQPIQPEPAQPEPAQPEPPAQPEQP